MLYQSVSLQIPPPLFTDFQKNKGGGICTKIMKIFSGWLRPPDPSKKSKTERLLHDFFSPNFLSSIINDGIYFQWYIIFSTIYNGKLLLFWIYWVMMVIVSRNPHCSNTETWDNLKLKPSQGFQWFQNVKKQGGVSTGGYL